MKSGNNVKLEHIEALLKRNIAQILHRDVRDQRLVRVNVTRVKVTPDLSHCMVYVIFADQAAMQEKLAALNSSAGFVRYKLAHAVKNLRKIPKLKFIYDESLEWSFELFDLLQKQGRSDNQEDI